MPGSILIYISLGSNIEPAIHLPKACNELQNLLDKALVSPIYQSPAVGMDGEDFMNAVIGGRTDLTLETLISQLRTIETEHGRIRHRHKFSDRTLDLDLLIFGEYTSQSTSTESGISIELPHPEIMEQAYVMQPLADIAPDLKHPVNGLTIESLCQQMKMDTPAKFNALEKVTI